MKYVPKNFNCRTQACYRTYKYLCPIKLFNKNNDDKEIVLQKIQKLCLLFYGYKGFHNYTTGFKHGDKKSFRNIRHFNAEKFDVNQEFIIFTIKSHGFLYHQIRKIIGIMIQVMNGDLDETHILKSFEKDLISIWLAPMHGLYLYDVNFYSY